MLCEIDSTVTLELLNAFPFYVSPSLSACDSCASHNVLPHGFQISLPTLLLTHGR